MKYPIYIPSLGRFENPRTVKMLKRANIDNFFVVVEKKEYKDYLKVIDSKNLLCLPSSDYGTSSVARNFAIDHAKTKKLWMLDDDITQIFKHEKAKRVGSSLDEIFTYIESYSERARDVKVVGMPTSASFLQQIKKDVNMNCSLTSIYLLTKDKFRFRGTMLVDIDYQLQVLRNGYNTMCLNTFAFSFITPLKIMGGYYPIYAEDSSRIKAIEGFLKYNPDVNPTITRSSSGYLKLKHLNKIWRKFK